MVEILTKEGKFLSKEREIFGWLGEKNRGILPKKYFLVSEPSKLKCQGVL